MDGTYQKRSKTAQIRPKRRKITPLFASTYLKITTNDHPSNKEATEIKKTKKGKMITKENHQYLTA
jgi:hypothetical protein